MYTVFITGSSRGIGLGVVKEFLQKPNFRVIATCRNPLEATILQELSQQYGTERLLLLSLDITSIESHQQIKESLLQQGIHSIDILFANAGVLTNRNNALSPSVVESARADFETNVIGTMLTIQTYSELVLASRLKIFSVTTSGMGSIANAEKTGGLSSYRMSKAGLNMYITGFTVDAEVQKNGGKVLLIHPGWVQTEMGGSTAAITVEKSAKGIMNLFDIAISIQLQSIHSAPPQYQSYYDHLNQNPLVYVVYNGNLLSW